MSVTCSNYTTKLSHSFNKIFYISNIKCIWCNRMIDVMIKLNYLKLKQSNEMNIRKKNTASMKKRKNIIFLLASFPVRNTWCVSPNIKPMDWSIEGIWRYTLLKLFGNWRFASFRKGAVFGFMVYYERKNRYNLDYTSLLRSFKKFQSVPENWWISVCTHRSQINQLWSWKSSFCSNAHAKFALPTAYQYSSKL